MPPKNFPPRAPLQKGTIGEGPPVKAGGKNDSSAIVKKESVSAPPRHLPASPVAAAKVNLPVQPSLRRPPSASDAAPLSSRLDDARETATAGGPASPKGPPSGHTPPPAVAHAPSAPGIAAARAGNEPKTENEVVKQLPSPLPPSIAAASVTSTPGRKPPPPGHPSLPASSKETSPPPGVLSSVPLFKKEGEALTPRPLSLLAPQPTADAAATAACVSSSPGPGGTPAAAKKKISPAPVAKKGPFVPLAADGARPVDLGAHPAAKEKTPTAPSAKNGPPINLAKQGQTSPPKVKAVPPAAKGGIPSAPPVKKVSPAGLATPAVAKESPTKTSGAKPVAASAPSISASGAAAAPGSPGTRDFASSPAAVSGSGAGPSGPVRMKTGLVGVGPPPGALLKTAYPGKAESSASPAVRASPPKKEGPRFDGDVKAASLQRTALSPLPAVTAAAAAVEREQADTAARRKEATDSASGRPHPVSALEAPLCEVVDQTGKFVGLAHGPPPPLTAQEPTHPLLHTSRRRGSGLWQSDRLAPEEPLPCSSRSTLQRAFRRRVGAADTWTGGIQYLPPFGVPPGWNTLPGFFFPAPACPLFFPTQRVSADSPAKPMYPPRRRSSSHRSRDTRLRQSFRSLPEQSVGASAALAGGEQYGYPPYYYSPVAAHPFFAYPYYTATYDVNPYLAALHNQQQSQQEPAYSYSRSPGPRIQTPLRGSRRDRPRWSSRGETAEVSAGSVRSETYSCSDEDDDPLRLTSKLRTPTSGHRDRSAAVGLRGLSTVPRRGTTKYARGEREERCFGSHKKPQDEAHSISSLDDIAGAGEAFRRPIPKSQRRGTEDTYTGFDGLNCQAALPSGPPARTSLRDVADTSVYGRTPWTRLERKLNYIRGGYGLTGSVPPERLPAQAERQGQVGEGARGHRQLVDRVTSRKASVEAATSATASRTSNVRHSWLRELPAGYAEEQREAEEFIGGDPYYKHFHTHYRRSKKPWVDEVAHPMGPSQRGAGLGSLPASGESFSRRSPRRRLDRWSFERGLTAPRRRTYQSLNELAAHFSRIEGEDQDELISLLLLTRRLEKQIDEQRLVIDDLEHELTTASATLKFPPEWRALEGIDLVSLVPADSAFQPSAATPLFLKSTVLLPKQLPDGSSAFTGVPAAALVDAATGAPAPPAVAAPSKQGAAPTASPPPAGAGKPAAPGKPAPPTAAGVAKPPTAAAAGATGGPKPPPPSAGMKKTLKMPGAVKKPIFKTSIKAKEGL